MASSKEMLVRVYFVLCFGVFVGGSNVGNIDGVQECRSIVRRMDELQNIVNIQSNRIFQLEKKNRNLEETITAQGEEIALLKSDSRDKMSIRLCEKKYSRLEKQLRSMMNRYKENQVSTGPPYDSATYSKQHDKSLIRKGRLLVPPTSPTTSDNAIGFYAYFSQNVPTPSSFHILVFDTVITNSGHGYHSHTGTFIAPRSGLYVFTWTIRLLGASYHSTEILVNNSIKGAIYFDSESHIDGCASNTVVVHVNQGDDVFLRTGEKYNTGDIVSLPYGRSSFAGWMIV